MNIKKVFGEKIKRLRKKRNLTQEQLAEKINISPRNLSKIEVGECFVKAETFDKIILALNTSVEEIFTDNCIKDNNEFLEYIYSYLNNIKDNNEKLEKMYRMIKFLEN